MNEYVLFALAKNRTGVLQRVTGLFSRRCYSIRSIVAAQTEREDISQITIVVQGDDRTVRQVQKQLSKLIDIVEVTILDKATAVIREHLLIKVGGNEESVASLVNIANMFKANILDARDNILILELTGDVHTLDSFVELLKPHNILRMIRTGSTAMSCLNDDEEE